MLNCYTLFTYLLYLLTSCRALCCQVVDCAGVSGSNAEYVTRLADFVRRHIPHDDDPELFQLDERVRQLLTSEATRAGGRRDHAPAVTDGPVASSSSTAAVVEHCEIAARDLVDRRPGRVVPVLAAG